jgi:hypothetical protein
MTVRIITIMVRGHHPRPELGARADPACAIMRVSPP